MGDVLIDFDSDELAFTISDNLAMDSDGDLLMKVGDTMAMDLESGELHLTSSWGSGDDDDE